MKTRQARSITAQARINRPLLVAGIALISALASSPVRSQPADPPCTDGVFYGDVSQHYRDILAEHAADPTGSLFSTLSLEKQNIVTECAEREDGPDAERYRLREVATDGQGNIIGRVYEYLDPAPSEVCPEAPATTPACRQGQYYYVALVMSGCYTDNVFGDNAYAISAGWQGTGSQGTSYVRLRQSDQGVINASCTGSPGVNLNPLHLDLIGLGNATDGGGAQTNDADDQNFNENVLSPSSVPFGFHAATSSVWNMLFSRWDAGDSNADGVEERDGHEDNWSSPWVIPASGSDQPPGSAAQLCNNLVCDLGYATTWFDDTNMWEWQVVYEFRWDVSSCTPIDPGAFRLAFNTGTHASPAKKNWEQCADPANLGALTVIKDSVPDNPWNDFLFTLTGPDPGTPVTLQDPGVSECSAAGDPEWPACGQTTPWNAEDRFSRTDLIPTNNGPFLGGPYRVTESAALGTDLTGYETSWECRNVDPVSCSAEVVATTDDPFELLPECAPIQPSSCGAVEGFAGGRMEGTGLSTDDFSVCKGAHVICKFTNEGGDDECVTSANAIGDLQVFGGVETETSAFSTAAVPLQSADAPDSIFLASFVPLADQARWPGNLDHFVLPLPLVKNAEQELVPDFSAVCTDDDDTACLAWRAGAQLVTQAPTALEVVSDRRIGLGADERRVTYSKAANGDEVPRTIRAFDWSDSDALADEYDLWNGLGLSFIAGDTVSEASARITARSIVNQTLQQRQITIPDPKAPSVMQTLTFVAGDFFHSDPVVVGAPSNFFFLANDLEGNDKACDDSVAPNRGYRCFFEKNQRRRHVVIAASNDGQIHAFDAGQFEGGVVSQKLEGRFTLGSGKELFAHLPRPMLDHASAMTQSEHEFGVDGGLVVDDVFIDALHDGTPDVDDREWRTVVFASYRDGDRGLVALDVTQPDPIRKVNVTDFSGQADSAWLPSASAGVVPICAGLGDSSSAGCGTLSYPAALWEFEDQCLGVPCDEDANGEPDLGDSWSQVNTGRILVNVPGESDPVVKFVAVFGGGLDAENRKGVGNWIYMVDIETGEALYKRAVTSAVASEPAAVDTDQNGFLDTLYFGTVGDTSDLDDPVHAFLYKADISTAADVDPSTGRISDPAQWAPFPIFDTGIECATPPVGEQQDPATCQPRSIFYPPTVTFVANQGRYALAFGTGDREDLFGNAGSGPQGRFYVILDPGFEAGTGVLSGGPLTESSFQQIDALDPGTAGDFLTAPLTGLLPGWVLRLANDERVVTKALLVSGLLVFTTFTSTEIEEVCTYEGSGNVYALLATNANSIAGVTENRALAVDGFAGRPVVTTTGMSAPGQAGGEVDPFEVARIQGIRDNLMDLFPADCRFGSFALNVSVTLSNSSVMPVASVPVCVARKNWTEHF